MLEFISNNTWIVWLALVVVCGIIAGIAGIVSAYNDIKHWEITVDGETFECVCALDIDRWHHEVVFWDEMRGCWCNLTYARIECVELAF